MSDDYVWVWTDRRCRVTVLKVRGGLDAVTADRFAAEAARELRQAPGLVAIDLSHLDFLDCAGARVLAAVVRAIPRWRLTEVCGVQPPVARLLDLIGIDLPATAGRSGPMLSVRLEELLEQARATRSQSEDVLLETSAAMARLATTYAALAAGRQRRAEEEQARAQEMQKLSETARDLATRYRDRSQGMPARAS